MLPSPGVLKGYKTYVLAAIGLITAVAAWLIGDLATPDMIEAVFAALAAMTLRAGIAKSGSDPGSGSMPLSGFLFASVLMLGGCAKFMAAGNPPFASASATAVEARTEANTGSTARMDGDTITAAYTQLTPTLFKQDIQGAWASTAGQGGTVSLIVPTGRTVDITGPDGVLITVPLVVSAHIWSPQDASVASFEVDPATGVLKIIGVQTNMSDVLTAQMPGVIQALTSTQGMDAEHAAAYIQAMVEKGEIAQSVADVAKSLIDQFPALLGAL